MKRPDEKVLLDNIGKIAYSLDKAYISRLSSDYGVLYFDEKYNKEGAIEYDSNIRAVRVDRWVFDREENPGECFKNIMSSFADGDHTLALVVKRTPVNTEMYFVIKNEGAGRNDQSRANAELLQGAIKGNFQGTHTKILDMEETENLFSFSDKIDIEGREQDAVASIAILTNTPSEYTEDYIGQGLDKLLNGIVPEKEAESYTVMFLAESLTQNDIREILSGYEDMATAIAPFFQYQFQMGTTENETQGEMESISDTESISNSVFKTHSINIGVNGGINKSRSDSTAIDYKGVAMEVAKVGTSALTILLSGLGGWVAGPPGIAVGRKIGQLVGGMGKAAASLAPTKTTTNEKGKSLGLSAGYGYSWGTSKTITNSKTQTRGTSSSISIGTNENTTYTYKSYLIADLLDKMEKTIKRINQSQATGLWKYSTYILANDAKITRNVANYLRAITQGKESFIEPAFIQEWSRQEGNGTSVFEEIKKYIAHFTHPIFVTADSNDQNGMMVTATSYVATDELSHVMVFPQKSLQGLPVLEGVTFGREPHSLVDLDADLEIGNAYHMHQTVKQHRIKISKEELTKHTFITGSTGSGKSNTIYKLIEQACAADVRFLVVEPAKGEYKDILGGRKGVTVYGTNPKLMKMLHLNPFSFPTESTHVLEHMDRLVEIFNVCWPMYAAMPAILKDAIERAYISAGWDLTTSENKFDDRLFPTFSDVLREIRLVLQESEYSADNKGDYTGALVTRLKSLTNGINGQIFTANSISESKLFDENVIVDLSRVGSSETKSLIMGLLVLKLQEHRMASKEPDARLQHLTVLEEAHNLLKRTSTEQLSEGSNLLGKSVEMIANAIAEMRTYGEGFVIADQSPGLLDMSVIRNTNTKIILRLPDYTDRELVGKAAGLNEEQIIELGRLERGVAAISQSDWLEPVLCKIDKYNVRCREPLCEVPLGPDCRRDVSNVEESILDIIMNQELYRRGDRIDYEKYREVVIKSELDTRVKCDFLEYVKANDAEVLDSLRKLVYDFFDAEKAIHDSWDKRDLKTWVHAVVDHLVPAVHGYSDSQIDLLMALILYEQTRRNATYDDIFCCFTEEYENKSNVF